MTLQGVLWDMDGVLVDTGEFHYRSWAAVLPDYGIEFSREFFRDTFGMKCFVLTTTNPAEALAAADAVVDRLDALAADAFQRLVAEAEP